MNLPHYYQKAQDGLKKITDEFKAKYCTGLSAEACGAKMDAHRDELMAGFAGAGLDFVPVVGTIKSALEAESALDYLELVASLIPGEKVVGDTLKIAREALNKGNISEASELINNASDEIVTISGGKGGWNKDLNNPLANKTYTVDGNKTFTTDELGRTSSVESDPSLLKNDRNTLPAM